MRFPGEAKLLGNMASSQWVVSGDHCRLQENQIKDGQEKKKCKQPFKEHWVVILNTTALSLHIIYRVKMYK